jgi:plasmid stability protein
MTLTIEIPDALEAPLKAQAQAQGVSADRYVRLLLETTLKPESEPEPLEPFETGRGIFAKYGPAPSAEEIDENRRDMFRNFARDED